MSTQWTPPAELPEKPEGWTQRMVMHLNFGEAGGAATYTIHDETGADTGIGYAYDTRPGGYKGFTLPGVQGVLTWQQVRAEWPEYLQRRP